MNNYKILPFRFERLSSDEVLLTNDVGEFIFISDSDFQDFTQGRLDKNKEVFKDLESRQMLAINNIESVISMLATKFRTKKVYLRILHLYI